MTIKAVATLEADHNAPLIRSRTNEFVVDRNVPRENRSCLTQEWPDQLELDSYQVALVPFRANVDDPDEGPVRTIVADKFLLLPFTWKDFMAKIRMGVSHPARDESTIFRFGQVQIDLLKMEARRSDRPVNLTAMEFKVLRFFVLNPDRVISRDELLNQVWGYDSYPCTRTVDNHVLRLRQKLEAEMASPVHFRTVHGLGYKFTP